MPPQNSFPYHTTVVAKGKLMIFSAWHQSHFNISRRQVKQATALYIMEAQNKESVVVQKNKKTVYLPRLDPNAVHTTFVVKEP